MSHYQVNVCPHCGKSKLIDVDPRFFHLHDVHLVRKPLDELPPRAFQRDLFCDYCQNTYYVTLSRQLKVAKANR